MSDQTKNDLILFFSGIIGALVLFGGAAFIVHLFG